jgi:hypothetical protein
LSLSLTLANGWLSAFGIYKKYVLSEATLEKLYREGWEFISGVNRYDGLTSDEKFSTFCSKVEQIITNTIIKKLSDNTAGVNVHDVLEVPKPHVPVETPLTAADESKTLNDTVVEIHPADNIMIPRRKKKASIKSGSNGF